jgi:hypothetical protein
MKRISPHFESSAAPLEGYSIQTSPVCEADSLKRGLSSVSEQAGPPPHPSLQSDLPLQGGGDFDAAAARTVR